MKYPLKTLLICAGISLSMGAIAAPDIDEVTLDVMENSNDLPDSVKEKIELPEHASEAARDASEHGMETANDNRHRGMDDGPDHDKGDVTESKEDAAEHKSEVEDHKSEVEDHRNELDDHKEGSTDPQEIELPNKD